MLFPQYELHGLSKNREMYLYQQNLYETNASIKTKHHVAQKFYFTVSIIILLFIVKCYNCLFWYVYGRFSRFKIVASVTRILFAATFRYGDWQLSWILIPLGKIVYFYLIY